MILGWEFEPHGVHLLKNKFLKIKSRKPLPSNEGGAVLTLSTCDDRRGREEGARAQGSGEDPWAPPGKAPGPLARGRRGGLEGAKSGTGLAAGPTAKGVLPPCRARRSDVAKAGGVELRNKAKTGFQRNPSTSLGTGDKTTQPRHKDR